MALIWVAIGALLAGALSAGAAEPPVIDPAKAKALATSREWHVLLHYRQGWFGRERSEADGAAFFLSPNGKTDPEAELLADWRAFRSITGVATPVGARPAACVFPSRFRWMRTALDPELPVVACPDFEKWKARFHPQSLIVVYAAPYLGSPASMFGHTFLRLSSDSPNSTDFGAALGRAPLDPAISFEAATGPGDGGVALALKGLFGFYPGTFSLQPYHLKMNLYSNLEARDLWEYELTLTPTEIDRLLDHAWELGTTYFDYFFFDKNCSYQLLSLIEAARPALRLREQFGIMAVPADTLRALTRVPGLVGNVSRRPSLLTVLGARLARMTPEERRRFRELRDRPALLGADESTAVLDALLDWQKYRVLSESRTLLDPEHEISPALLRARARAAEQARATDQETRTTAVAAGNTAEFSATEINATEVDGATPPDRGHPTSRASAGIGLEGGQVFAQMELRPVLHDLLDYDEGYLRDSRLVLADTWVEIQPRQAGVARLQELTFAEVETLPRWDSLRRPFSWSVGGGLLRPEDTGCASCLAGSFRAAGGLAGAPVDALLLYAAARGEAQASGMFSRFLRAGPALEAGVIWRLGPSAKLRAEFAPTWFTGGVSYWRVDGGGQFDLSPKIVLRGSAEYFLGGSSAVVDPERLVASVGFGF